MQINTNPMPATGELMAAEAAPEAGKASGKAQANGSANMTGKPGSQKGFRETMDGLLTSADSGEENFASQESPRAPEGNEAPAPEAALLEITGLPIQTQQHDGSSPSVDAASVGVVGKEAALVKPPPSDKVAPLRSDRSQPDVSLKGQGETSTSVTDRSNVYQGSSLLQKSVVQSKAPKAQAAIVQSEAPKAQASVVQGEVPKISSPPAQGEPASEGTIRESLVDPKASSELKGVSEPIMKSASAEMTSLKDSRVALFKAPETGGAHAKELNRTTGKATAGDGPKMSYATRSPQVQVNSGQQTALNAESAPNATTVETPSAEAEGRPQGFTTLVESIEKGGAEARPLNMVSDNPLEAATTSGTKNIPTPQSTSGEVAKADPATPQPLPKEEVIQQIVDSAKLRFKNAQGEMRIQLKPESMGHVRLSISTDQHQVMVKVVAELPIVKEILESNLSQLRTELQGQGLEIDKFDVSVGGDNESQNKEQQTWAQRQNQRRREGAFTQGDPKNSEEQPASRSQQQTETEAERESDGVDYFA